MNNKIDYDAREARLIDPDEPIRSAGQAKTGHEAAAEGRAFLLREYGSRAAIERAMRPGRPRLSEAKGASPAVRDRLTHAEYAAFRRLMEETGQTQSQLVRDAVHRLLEEVREPGYSRLDRS